MLIYQVLSPYQNIWWMIWYFDHKKYPTKNFNDLNCGSELKIRGVITSFHRKNIHSLPLTFPHKPDLNADVAFELLITPNGGYMLKDTDFEFPKRESKLDRVWVEWQNLTNDKEKSIIVMN